MRRGALAAAGLAALGALGALIAATAGAQPTSMPAPSPAPAAPSPAPAPPGPAPAAPSPAPAVAADPFAVIHRLADPAHPTPEEATHAPWIRAPRKAKRGQVVNVDVQVGRTPHEMTADHHVLDIELWTDQGLLARVEPTPRTPLAQARVAVRVDAPVRLRAVARCNRHGIWEARADVGF